MYKFLLAFLAIGASAFFFKFLAHNDVSQTIVARVSLKTNCDLDLKAFAVKNLNSGEIRAFQHGEAFIKASLADELMIVLSEKFDSVSLKGEIVLAKQRLEVFQDCNEPIGIAGIFKSFNDQFSNN